MVKCALAIAKRKKQARESLHKNRQREQLVMPTNPICDIAITSVKDSAPAEDQLRNLGSTGKRKGESVSGKWSTRHQEKPPEPPDPQEDYVSRLALGDCDQDSSNVEHSLATEYQNNSQNASPSPQPVNHHSKCHLHTHIPARIGEKIS